MKLATTHHCNELRIDHESQRVTLAGWVNNYRDHGGVIFIDLRDREGLTQLVFYPDHPQAHELADKLRHEDVICATGTVASRGQDDQGRSLANPKLATGEIEVVCDDLEILNKSQTPPFTPDEAERVSEERRLTYRFIDLRRPTMMNIMRTRHRVTKIVRDYFDQHDFYEIETPFLCRSTPEGARDYLVPSRLHAGSFYALPQSPQLFKQVLMVSGIGRYLQIVKCFRDEDPRADRQAEFTQIDLEMSFVDRDQVMALCEGMVREIWKQVLDVDVPPVARMTYDEAIGRYGTDRPDLRYGLELVDVTDLANQTDFRVFQSAIGAGGMVKAIRVPGGAKLTRKQTDALAEWVKQFGLGGLPVTKLDGGNFTTGVAKFMEPIREALCEKLQLADGDLVCFGVHEKPAIVHRGLGEVRIRLAKEMDMLPQDQWNWLWVVDFPMVEYDDDENRYDALHHPFTAPYDEDVEMLESQPAKARSKAYDLILNGNELGGGSIRIHRADVQQKVFSLLGIDETEARAKFGFLLDALNFGAPPHGGFAFGLDRMIMLLTGRNNIRDVIAFPKTQNGADLMTAAPSTVDDKQLQELHLRLASSTQNASPPPSAPTDDQA